MRINKKIALYVFIAVVLASSSVIYVAAAKNNWRNKDSETKKISEKKIANKPAPIPSPAPFPTVPDPNNESVSVPASTPVDVPITNPVTATADASEYPLHKNISTTYFWIGEEAGKDNGNISNLPSAWDEDWAKHFGGVDNPDKRKDFCPASFTPKENPFYFALPYNDFNEKGKPKNDAVVLAMWAKNKKFGAEESICKNQWIKVTKNGKSAYAQWEDVGPFGEDDKSYVFGTSVPKSKENNHAGLDVSPAVRDYLNLNDIDKTDWQFVDAQDVPAGPWKKIVTTSQICWN
jgi:hypothetical protein